MVLVGSGVEPGCPVIEVVSSEPAVVDVPEVVDVGFDAENFKILKFHCKLHLIPFKHTLSIVYKGHREKETNTVPNFLPISG